MGNIETFKISYYVAGQRASVRYKKTSHNFTKIPMSSHRVK